MRHDNLTQDVKTKAHDLGAAAKDAIRTEAERNVAGLRDNAADKVTAAANAAGAAAAHLDPESIQARAAQQVADQVEGLAHRLRTTDLNSVTRDVSQFARNNPALFIGGAALLGLAATRFLKARDPHRIDYGTGDVDPWHVKHVRTAPTGGSHGTS